MITVFIDSLSRRVHEAILLVKDEEWTGESGFGVTQVADRVLKLRGWTRSRRVVVSRKLIEEKSPTESCTLLGICQYEYGAYVTNSENIFDEMKNQWGLEGFCSKKLCVTEFAARMTILSYNLWSIFVRFFNLVKIKY